MVYYTGSSSSRQAIFSQALKDSQRTVPMAIVPEVTRVLITRHTQVHAYPQYAASALAANSFMRYIFSSTSSFKSVDLTPPPPPFCCVMFGLFMANKYHFTSQGQH